MAVRSGKINKRNRAGWLGLAALGPGHQKPGTIPGDCAVGSASPGSERRGASLQSCCLVSAGRAGALAEHNASSSPFHPGHTLLLLLTEGSRPARSPRGSVWVPNASLYFQALFSSSWSFCFLQGWTGSKAASHEPLTALICLSPGPTAARLVPDSRSHLKLQGSSLQSCPPSLTKAIQTLPGRRRESQHPANHPRHSHTALKTLILLFPPFKPQSRTSELNLEAEQGLGWQHKSRLL